jgi:protein SCO1/2
MSAKMKRILNRTGNGIHLVSFTVDPEHDLPPVLTAYAKRFGADPSRWSFLTGAHDELQRLNRNVFKLGDLTSTLEHSTRFVLVDAHRRIRAYYRMGDEDLIDRVVEDAKQLEREGS